MALKDIVNAGKALVGAISGTASNAVTEARDSVVDNLDEFVQRNKKETRMSNKIEVMAKPAPHREDDVTIVVLEKGANVAIDAALDTVSCGIEWDEVTTGPEFDADVSCLLVKDGEKNELIYYGTPKTNGQILSSCGSVLHTGDNLTGADDAVAGVDVEEDDETIITSLVDLPANVKKVVFFVNIHQAEQKNQNFGTSGTMGVRLYNTKTGAIFMEADLMEDNAVQTSMVVGEFYRKDAGWKYKNMAQGGKQTISEFANAQ